MKTNEAILSVQASIEDLRTAFSQSNCQRLHDEIIGYCRALKDCKVIDDNQCAKLVGEADVGLRNWQRTADPILFE